MRSYPGERLKLSGNLMKLLFSICGDLERCDVIGLPELKQNRLWMNMSVSLSWVLWIERLRCDLMNEGCEMSVLKDLEMHLD